MKHLSSAFLGQNQWWKYVLLPIIAIIAGNIVAMIPMIIIVAIKAVQSGIDFTENPGALGDLTQLGLSQNLILAIQLVVFAASLILFLVLFQPFHKRNFKELVNGTGTVRWNRFFFSAFIWSVLMVAYLGVIYFTSPDNFEFHFNASAFIPLVVVALLLFPFQTTFEEVVFRGYLAQGFGIWSKNRWIALILPAILFALMHAANPEVKEHGFWLTMPQYLTFGLFFGLAAILDDGIEIAMGTHAANNIFLSLFITNKAAAVQTPALFTQLKVDPVQDLYLLVIISALALFVFAKKYKWNWSILNKKVESLSDDN
jgi:membrane protease YdiL (CAAX protease family)